VDGRPWLDAWLAEEPDSPDALTVAAERQVVEAWNARSSRRAVDVDEDRWRAFRIKLDEATPVVRAAVEANETDPIPWMSAVTLATGYGASRDEFERVVQGFMHVDPANVHCHGRALNFLMPRWYGQPGEAPAYGDWAADLGGPASRLQLLPLKCEFEHLVIEPPEEVPFDSVLRERRTGVHRAIDRAEAWLTTQAEHDHVGARTARSYLALMHHFVGHHGRAFEHFVQMGPDATRYPWAFYGEPLDRLVTIRRQITAKYAKTLG